jgi:hypothetical protein
MDERHVGLIFDENGRLMHVQKHDNRDLIPDSATNEKRLLEEIAVSRERLTFWTLLVEDDKDLTPHDMIELGLRLVKQGTGRACK